MEDNLNHLYRLDGVAHIVSAIHLEPHRCITNIRYQHGMQLDDRIVPYLQMAGLYYLSSRTRHGFDWTSHWSDVAYQLGLPIDGQYVSGCLTDFVRHIEGGRPTWIWFEELLSVLPPANNIDKFTTFSELSQGADDETVKRYARAYIMMLLSIQLFEDKPVTRLYIHWLPYVAKLEDMVSIVGGLLHCHSYSGACAVWRTEMSSSWPVHYSSSNRGSSGDSLVSSQTDLMSSIGRWRPDGQPTLSDKGPCKAHWKLRIDLLHSGDYLHLLLFMVTNNNYLYAQFLWMTYSLPDVVQVVHPEILEP
ncbi:hypothetical protein Ahy_A05g022951 isoform A [Arachis hypogaea]|uniref:Aminotransferase-like plant mobile domain-containing protein n=1 Tax=Arachis hypogaea TaxID=3818 RepID=A0A445D218_ARAHY|nr:hypothetical protein Ahy_A05g022951 isoform A [Arachis hypogaea]